jgi:hypothetical protein
MEMNFLLVASGGVPLWGLLPDKIQEREDIGFLQAATLKLR